SAIGFGSISNRLSRPTRTLRTMPASASTRRCFVTACRDRLVPSVRRAMDCGSPLSSLPSTASRVSSPSAANTAARIFSALGRLCCLLDMLRDVSHLCAPAAVVHAERLSPTVARNPIEARLDDAQQGPCRSLLQRELNERRWFGRVVHLRIGRIGVPGERE